MSHVHRDSCRAVSNNARPTPRTRVGALSRCHPGHRDTPVGPGRTPTVHRCPKGEAVGGPSTNSTQLTLFVDPQSLSGLNFFHVLSCSFMFFHVLLCSFIFFHFLSFSLLGAQNLIFFWGLNFVTISLDSSYVKNQFLGPSRVVVVGTPLGPLFLFFLFFSRFFLSFFLLFIFSFFLFFCSFLHFLIF